MTFSARTGRTINHRRVYYRCPAVGADPIGVLRRIPDHPRTLYVREDYLLDGLAEPQSDPPRCCCDAICPSWCARSHAHGGTTTSVFTRRLILNGAFAVIDQQLRALGFAHGEGYLLQAALFKARFASPTLLGTRPASRPHLDSLPARARSQQLQPCQPRRRPTVPGRDSRRRAAHRP
jgi:hypothetical protein